MISIEKATAADCGQIAIIHAACWAEVYDFIPERVHKARSVEYRRAQWLSRMESPSFGDALFCLKHKARVVGFCFAKKNEELGIPALGELHAAYILPPYRGGVSGPMLMSAMVRSLIQDELTPISLWAFKQNRMKHAYRALGWRAVVSRDRVIAGCKVPETCFIHPDLDDLLGRLDALIRRGDVRQARATIG